MHRGARGLRTAWADVSRGTNAAPHRGDRRQRKGRERVAALEGELSRRDPLAASHVRAQRLRDLDRPVFALIVLHDRDHETRQSEAGPIQQVRVSQRSAGLAPIANAPSLRLERAAVAAGRDLEPLTHARRPRLDVESTHRLERQIARAQLEHPHGNLEPLEDVDRTRDEALELFRRVLGVAVDDHLDLVELMTALDPADIAARAHLLAQETGRVRNVPERKAPTVEHLVAME